MEIITFVAPANGDNLGFIRYLDRQLSQLLQDDFSYDFSLKKNNLTCLRCLDWPKYLASAEVVNTFRHYFSTGIAEYIVEELEQELIMAMLRQDFYYREEQVVLSIYRYCHQMLFIDEETSLPDERKIGERKGKIYTKAYEYLAEERPFDLTGFLQFRLQHYVRELRDVLEYAIDEYILDQEYQEFIRLLRYFISTRETRIPLLHLLHIEDNHFFLYNEHKKMITEPEIEQQLLEWSGQDIMYEGMVISTLVSMAPLKIIVHTLEPTLRVMYTLKTIFLDRLVICSSCPDCRQWRKQAFENKETIGKS